MYYKANSTDMMKFRKKTPPNFVVSVNPINWDHDRNGIFFFLKKKEYRVPNVSQWVMKCSNFTLEVNKDVKITQFVYFPAPPNNLHCLRNQFIVIEQDFQSQQNK